jgi:hypothetical protein
VPVTPAEISSLRSCVPSFHRHHLISIYTLKDLGVKGILYAHMLSYGYDICVDVDILRNLYSRHMYNHVSLEFKEEIARNPVDIIEL